MSAPHHGLPHPRDAQAVLLLQQAADQHLGRGAHALGQFLRVKALRIHIDHGPGNGQVRRGAVAAQAADGQPAAAGRAVQFGGQVLVQHHLFDAPHFAHMGGAELHQVFQRGQRLAVVRMGLRRLHARAHLLAPRYQPRLLQLGNRRAHGVAAHAIAVAQLQLGGQQGAHGVFARGNALGQVARHLGIACLSHGRRPSPQANPDVRNVRT